jgi:hypothetical protein
MRTALIIASAYCASVLLSGSAIAQTVNRGEWDSQPTVPGAPPWLAVEIKCPAGNASIFERVRRNVLGGTEKFTVTYRNGSVSKYSATVTKSGRETTIHVEFLANGTLFNGEVTTDAFTLAVANNFRNSIDKAMWHYCLSESEERIALGKEIAENRRMFGIR